MDTSSTKKQYGWYSEKASEMFGCYSGYHVPYYRGQLHPELASMYEEGRKDCSWGYKYKTFICKNIYGKNVLVNLITSTSNEPDHKFADTLFVGELTKCSN